jgi:hypothetical protein
VANLHPVAFVAVRKRREKEMGMKEILKKMREEFRGGEEKGGERNCNDSRSEEGHEQQHK